VKLIFIVFITEKIKRTYTEVIVQHCLAITGIQQPHNLLS